MIFKRIKTVLRKSIDYVITHSKKYKELDGKHETFIGDYIDLAGRFHIKREKVEGLERKVEDRDERIIKLNDLLDLRILELGVERKHVVSVEEDNAYLQRDNKEFKQKLIDFEYYVENALEVCYNVRTSYDVIKVRIEDNNLDSKKLIEWLEGPKTTLETESRIIKQQASIFEGFAFGGRVNTFMNQNPKARKMPMAFYDFVSKEFYYNDKLRNLLKLGVNLRGSHLALGDLLRKVDNEQFKPEGAEESISKRRYLLRSLREGEPLDDFEFFSPKESKIYLTTRPIQYTSRCVDIKTNKSFGILMFFSQLRYFRYGPINNSKKYAEALQLLGEDFEVIYKDVKNAKKK